MEGFQFTSESVGVGHPDKVADQIADAILDACLAEDPQARVACEVLVTKGLVVLVGEISTIAQIDYQRVARDTIKKIGYDQQDLGFHFESCGVIQSIHHQSPDIAEGVDVGSGLYKDQGAGDQGMMFGFASDETEEFLPMPIALAHRLMRHLRELQVTGTCGYLRPDAKTQITVQYDQERLPVKVSNVVLSTQHHPEVSHETLVQEMKEIIIPLLPQDFVDEETTFYINPTGRFILGGPQADSGMTGRKNMVDTYGSFARHGGGSFSGKDPSKVDRSGAYAARYVAKNLVAAGVAKCCEVRVSYAIGVPFPVGLEVETFGTESIDRTKIVPLIEEIFDLTPKGIVESLDLERPIYLRTAFGGHFGRPDFPWEKLDKVEDIKNLVHRI